jgi:hypothetical protein
MAAPVLTPPGRLTRWRLAEPVRFYLAGPFLALVVWVAGLVAAGEWGQAATAGAVAALLVGAGEAGRASVFSEVSHVAGCRDTALRVARGELIP